AGSRGRAERRRSAGVRVSCLSFALEPVPPFRLDRTVWALRRRPDNAIDQWDGQAYRRGLVIEREPVPIAGPPTGRPDARCPQVTLTLGIRVLNRLADTYGLAAGRDQGPAHAFPEPDALARLESDALRGVGLSHQKARALLTLAGALTEGTLDLGALETMDD